MEDKDLKTNFLGKFKIKPLHGLLTGSFVFCHSEEEMV